MSLTEKVFLLETRKSEKKEDTTYCIGIHRLGTPNMEFIMGELKSDMEYENGCEISYIYNAEYTSSLRFALKWLDNVK